MVDLLTATVTLTSDGAGGDGAIVGDSAGCLGGPEGVLVAAAVAGKAMAPLVARLDFTFAGQAYIGSPNICLECGDLRGSLPLAQALAGESSVSLAMGFPALAPRPCVGEPMRLVADGTFGQPGAAAGVAVLTVIYVLI